MSTEPEDDLDITAELPQLDMQAAQNQYAADGTDATDYLPVQVHARNAGASQPGMPADGLRTTSIDGWPTVNELVSVRDKIVDLEAGLLDAELKTARLEKQHQELLAAHVSLGTREAETGRDRDRLDAERALLIESHQQLQQRFDQHQAQAASSVQSLQQQLEQLRQQAAEQQTEKSRRQEQHESELALRNEHGEQLSAELRSTQVRALELESRVQTAAQQQTQQEMAAAALAGNLAHEMFENKILRGAVVLREQRIAALETTSRALQEHLDTTETRHVAVLADVEQLQGSVQSHVKQIAELQENLRIAEQRSGRLTELLDVEQSRNRSAEQDKKRLTRLAAAEHETYESTRKELAGHLAELNSVQEQFNQARAEITSLNGQLGERESQLRERDEALTAKQQALQSASDDRAAAHQREASLAENLAVLQEELQQLQTALQSRTQAHQAVELQLNAECVVRQQVQTQLDSLHAELQQLQIHLQQRDQFILDQAAELDEAQRSVAEFETQLQSALVSNDEQLVRIAALETERATLRAEYAQKTLLLVQVQQELNDKQAEQGATAKQVEGLQQELHQHVEALNAIRRDIHLVAQQSRNRESELQVRTLVRVDDESVVHLLNKPVMVIGRANDAEICIRSTAISRRHACLRVGRDVVIVEDLGSTNGCYVNGKRIKRQLLKDGDRLEVGDMKFRFATRVAQS
jgi:DNA repair exonuclease SbcCD ATPase subunit